MMALAATVLLLAYLAVCGRGWLALFGIRIGHARTWLISPALGLCLNVIVLLIPNQAGIPLAGAARPIVLALLLFSVAVITWRKAWRPGDLGIFALIGAVLLGGSAWPMGLYGFNWTSYGNDDMTNYCLAAERLLRHGFYDTPTLAELAGADYSQFYWFMHVAHLVRVGSETWIAGVAGTLGRPPIEIFMPVIFSLAVSQIWALGALLYSCPRKRRHALFACTLVVFCPLWNYGALVQLIAQVAGIAVLLVMTALTARTRFGRSWRSRLRQAGVIGTLGAGISLIYPEVIPFLVLTLVFTTAGHWLRTRRMIPGQIPVALLSIALLTVVLRHNVFSTYIMSLGQAASGMTMEDIGKTIFPYLLMPKGVSYLLGFESIVIPWPEPWGSIGICLGLIGLLVATVCGVRGLWRSAPASCLFVVMLLVGARLFAGNNGFGLFKLAMFILPVLVAEIGGVLAAARRTWLAVTMAALLALGWLPAHELYVHYSRPSRDNVFLEIEEASRSRGDRPQPGTYLLADIMSQPLAKLASMAPSGRISFRSQPFYKAIVELRLLPPPVWSWRFNPRPDTLETTHRLEEELKRQVFLEQNAFGTIFWTTPPDSGPAPTRLLTSVQELNSFNALTHLKPSDGLYTQVPLDSRRNHLVFIHSQAGQHYYLGQPGAIGVYKAQADVYSATGSFFAIGQSLVFEVLNPSPRVRLRFSFTNSIMGFGRTRLPVKAAAFGRTGAPASFGIVGAGSTNAFSQPLEPLVIDGRHYVAMNLFRMPDHFPPARPAGMNLLYNREVQLDPRLFNGYCRDISLISEEDYQQMPRPREVHRFPDDLISQPNLEYSGIYEDGWISRECFLTLGAVKAGEHLVISGMLPELPGKVQALADNTLELRLNGELAATIPVGPGELKISHPLSVDAPVLRIELRFAREAPLPGNDQRPIAALLTSVGIQADK